MREHLVEKLINYESKHLGLVSCHPDIPMATGKSSDVPESHVIHL